MATRKQITEFIVNSIDKILPDGNNKKRTQKFLDSMTNEEFVNYVRKLGNEEARLTLIAPNGAKVKLSTERNIQVAKELGIELYQRIWFSTPDGRGKYLSPHKYMILMLPVRRQCQILTKKISIPQDNKSMDTLTGQPAGKSKGSKISFPELQTLSAQNLIMSLQEMLHYRGGDNRGKQIMDTRIHDTGDVSIKAIENYRGDVESTMTLSAYLTAMHLRNNLATG